MEAKKTIGVIFLGDAGVGKTTIIHKQCNETLDPVATINTGTFPINIDGIDLLLYDTAGQERFRSTATFFYNKASIAVIVFDVTNDQSFQNLNHWISTLQDYMNQLTLVLVGNKVDLVQNFESEEVLKLKNDLNCHFILTSATTGAGINDLFHHIADIASTVNMPSKTDECVIIDPTANKKSNCC